MSKTSAQDRAVAYVRDNQGCHSMNVAMACDSNCTPESGYKAVYGFKTVERALQRETVPNRKLPSQWLAMVYERH